MQWVFSPRHHLPRQVKVVAKALQESDFPPTAVPTSAKCFIECFSFFYSAYLHMATYLFGEQPQSTSHKVFSCFCVAYFSRKRRHLERHLPTTGLRQYRKIVCRFHFGFFCRDCLVLSGPCLFMSKYHLHVAVIVFPLECYGRFTPVGVAPRPIPLLSPIPFAVTLMCPFSCELWT